MSRGEVGKSSLGQWSKRYKSEMQCGGVCRTPSEAERRSQVERRGQVGSRDGANEDLAVQLRAWVFYPKGNREL